MNVIVTGIYVDGKPYCGACLPTQDTSRWQGKVYNTSAPTVCAHCGAKLTQDEQPKGLDVHIVFPKK